MILDYALINQMVINTRCPVDELFREAGIEHYKLLAYMSTLLNGVNIIDIGTHRGWSSLALSTNKANKVYTFDIVQKLSAQEQADTWINGNVEYTIADILSSPGRDQWQSIILGSPLIFLDIDPHDGGPEYVFYTWLVENNYKGILLLDDIWFFKGMRDKLWYKIPGVKYDLTGVGHWSGTGLVPFNGQQITIREKLPPRISESSESKSWTVVTAYFNLTLTPDASAAIKERDQSYYLQHANMTMALDVNLVIYTDKSTEPLLRSLRPAHLAHKTLFIITEFMDVPVVKDNYERLVESRKRTGYAVDPRNTPSYYLLCMARYDLLLRTIAENPFESTHFAWCNLCIERMSWKSGFIFPKVWEEYRDKFSTCYIDYQTRAFVMDNTREYFKWGWCSMCSGFFTGNIKYMYKFCKAILVAFDDMLAIDCGHADEQLFSIVYFKNPELFEFYLGDYSEMIVNYGWLRDRPYEPVKNVLSNLHRSCENPALLNTLANRWLESYSAGAFNIDASVVSRIATFLDKTTF